MQASDLKPARDFARMYGCKSLIFGGTGSGKTPIMNTCPRPLLLACEPGLLSLRNSVIPTFYAENGTRIDEFFKWFFNSAEVKNFDTLCVDSISFMADVYLTENEKGTSAAGKKVHGLQAYGNMARSVMDYLRPLYYTREKHTYLICKEELVAEQKRPYFPGQQLNKDVPGLYDFVLHLGIKNVIGQGQVKAFQCNESYDVMARNRTGNLDDFEPPNFDFIVRKAMG